MAAAYNVRAWRLRLISWYDEGGTDPPNLSPKAGDARVAVLIESTESASWATAALAEGRDGGSDFGGGDQGGNIHTDPALVDSAGGGQYRR